jgi:hypothetical protein
MMERPLRHGWIAWLRCILKEAGAPKLIGAETFLQVSRYSLWA